MSSDYIKCAKAAVERSRLTRKTRHTRDGQLLPVPHSLEIVQLPEADGYYLLYLDENGSEMTDTWHESIEQAMDQANFEFGLLASEWESPGPPSVSND